ncbi:MAG: peptidase M48, partial [Acetobacteraceae bacterium]
MRLPLLAAVLTALAGCVASLPPPAPPPPDALAAQSPAVAAENFVQVVNRVEPVAESYCRSFGVAANCDFRIVLDDRPRQPPNAFQTVDRLGRPVLGFTVALIADARNQDEIAFVLGHEAAHHISGHIAKRR